MNRGMEYGSDEFEPVALEDLDGDALRSMGVDNYIGKVYVSIQRYDKRQEWYQTTRIFMGKRLTDDPFEDAEIFGFEKSDKILMTLGETDRRVKLRSAMESAKNFIEEHRTIEERQSFLGADLASHEILQEWEF